MEIQKYCYPAGLKATIDIPDELYRRVKAKSALEGKRIRGVTIGLYRRWLAEIEASSSTQTPEAWLKGWIRLADEAMQHVPQA